MVKEGGTFRVRVLFIREWQNNGNIVLSKVFYNSANKNAWLKSGGWIHYKILVHLVSYQDFLFPSFLDIYSIYYYPLMPCRSINFLVWHWLKSNHNWCPPRLTLVMDTWLLISLGGTFCSGHWLQSRKPSA